MVRPAGPRPDTLRATDWRPVSDLWEQKRGQQAPSVEHPAAHEMSEDELHAHNRKEHGALFSHGLPRNIHERAHAVLHGERSVPEPGEASKSYNSHPILALHTHAGGTAPAPTPAAPVAEPKVAAVRRTRGSANMSRWANLPSVESLSGGK